MNAYRLNKDGGGRFFSLSRILLIAFPVAFSLFAASWAAGQNEEDPAVPELFAPVHPLPAEAGAREPAPAAPPLFSAEQWRALERRGIVRIELRPARPRQISAPFSGRLREVFIRDGEELEKDSPVALFDDGSLLASLEEARKDMDAALERVRDAQGASDTVLEYARQELTRKAEALAEARERLNGARLTAPAAGRIIEVFAKAGQFLKRGDPIAEMAEPGDMEIVSAVPSAWIARIKSGHTIWVYINETSKSYEAEFARFAGKVNSADNSIKAYAVFRGSVPELLPGMSGRADFFPERSGR